MNNHTIDTTYTQRALSMYKENVSPSETHLQAILSQIPEQQNLKEGRAVRSPYRWLAVTQLMTVFAIVLAILPSSPQPQDASLVFSSENPYYEVDTQVASFEAAIDQEDIDRASSLTTL